MQDAEEKAGKIAQENARDGSQEIWYGETVSNSLHPGFPHGIYIAVRLNDLQATDPRVSITWELVRNANSRPHPRPVSLNLRG